MDDEKADDQAVIAWHHFTLWREKNFAGYLAIIAALGFAFLQTPSPIVRLVLFLGSGLVSIAFWVLDFRNGQLLNECQSTAARLENGKGVYSALNNVRFSSTTWATYSLAVDLLVAGVLGTSLGGITFYAVRVPSTAINWLAPTVAAFTVPALSCVLYRIRNKRWSDDKERGLRQRAEQE